MEMTLNDFFNINQNEMSNYKIALCKTNGRNGEYLFNKWIKNRDVSFGYHYKNGRGNTFKLGNICFVFVQKPDF